MIEYSGILEWDSNFFNKKIAIIKRGQATIMQLMSEIGHLIDDNIDLIYVFSPQPLKFEDPGWILVDKKRTYILEHPTVGLNNSAIVKYEGHPERLYSLAFQAGHCSRFKLDPNFSNGDFERLYQCWIDNSLQQNLSDQVLVFSDTDDMPLGLITAKCNRSIFKIGLFAVDKNYRGRGIGSQLIQGIINTAATENLAIEVATQAENTTACIFYERHGFTIKNEEFVYHLWINHK